MASAEDMRTLLERIGGMERALIEQQARVDQASTALQALQQQQQQHSKLSEEPPQRRPQELMHRQSWTRGC